jgi:hypothetical protein
MEIGLLDLTKYSVGIVSQFYERGRFFRSGVRGPYAPFCERKAARLIT